MKPRGPQERIIFVASGILISLAFAFSSLSLSLFTWLPSSLPPLPSFSALSSLFLLPQALAAPPSSPYTPGETLNPTCSPGEANCTVVAPPAGTGSAGLLTYWTATSTVSSSLSLFWDNPTIRLGIGTSQPSSTLHIISGTTGATTLQLMGLQNQTGNLLTISSSSGQRYFTLSSVGVASSTEFRTPSSTIDVLTLTSASSTGNITIGGTLQANAGQSTFSNVSSTNLDILTRLNFSAASGTGNVTLGGTNTQILNQLTFANASSTNLDVATRLTFSAASSTGNLTIGGTFQSNAGQTTLASVSSTNAYHNGYLTVTGNGLFSGSNLSIAPNTTSTSLVFIQGTSVSSTTLNIFGTTSQTASLLTISSSTGIPLFNVNALGQLALATSTYPASSTLLTIASSSQIFNISAGGNVMIGTSTAPNGALLQIATTTNILTVLSNGRIGIGTSTPGSALDVKGTLRLSGSSSGYVGFAPAAAAGATTYTLPSSDGTSGQVLTTDGAGTLSWTTKTEGISQDFKGLSLRTSPNAGVAATTVVLDHADEIVMDTGNRVATWDDLSAAITTSGAGGLDTGSEAASTWYEIYAIRKSSDGTKNLLLHRAKDYLLDQSQTTNDNVVNGPRVSAPTQTKIAQSIVPGTTGNVEFVDILMNKNGSPTGQFWFTLEADSSGNPSGTALATSDKLDASLVTTAAGGQYIRIVFRSPTSLTSGTTYWLVMNFNITASDANNMGWRRNTAGGYASGQIKTLDSGTWTAGYSGQDLAFKTYVTENNTSVTMPSGYDQKAKVGYVRNDGSSNFSGFSAIDHQVSFFAPGATQVSYTSAVPTLADASSYLPPVSVMVNFFVDFGGASTQRVAIGPVPTGYYLGASTPDDDNFTQGGAEVGAYASAGGAARIPTGALQTEFQGIYVGTNVNQSAVVIPTTFTWGSTGGADVAEEYLVNDESINAGDIVSLTDYGTNYIDRATASSSYPVLGIVSTKPGIRLKDWAYNPQNNRAVALTGRVPVKISEENGVIKTGDHLTLSATKPGYAMKMTEPGESIGIALESSSGKDKILTFVNIGYWVPTISSSTDVEGASSSSVSSSPLDNLIGYIVKKFQDLFDIVFNKGLLKVAHLITDLIETKKVVTEEVVTDKLELKDAATGGVYCIKMLNGQLASVLGGCASDSSSSSATSSVSDADSSDSTASSTDLTTDTTSTLTSTSTEP